MIGAVWNVRGLNKKGRLQCVTDFIKNNNLDFVGFQETKKESFQESYLNCIHKGFNWQFVPANGTAGGILVGFNDKKFDVLAWKIGNFSIAAMVKNCHDNSIWRFITVYGSPYDEGKHEFILEMEGLLDNWDGPTVIGGDFNLICTAKEKSNGVINHKWADLFLEWISKFGLIELKPSTRSFTWSNNQDQPVLAALDKIFCTVNFEQRFPLAFVTTSSRAGSDHAPLILNLGLEEIKKPALFRFEKWWLEQPDFRDLISNLWNTPCAFTNLMDIWQKD